MENATSESLAPDPQKELASQKIAILFTDLKGSTAFYKTHGNVAGRIMIQKLNDMLFPVVRAYKGSVVKTIGDSIMASFLSPKEALWSAIAMQKRLQTYSMEHNDPKDQMLIRVAINYGYGLVEERDVFGDVVNVAGKLISCCEAQKILITEAFYSEVQDTLEVTFSPFQIKDKKKDLEKLTIYMVNWESTELTTASPSLYLFSLRLEKTSAAGMPAENIQKILPLISRSALKVINADESEINAIFQSPQGCIEAAQKAIQNYLSLASEGSELPHVLKSGLHAVAKDTAESGRALTLFDEAIRARDNAEPYEIVLTAEFYSALPPDLKSVCAPAKGSADARSRLYLLQAARTGTQKSVFTPILPDAGSILPGELCFYCGCHQHTTDRCPSKLIRAKTAYLEKLGYMPLHRIRQQFQEHFPNIIKPLKSGSDEERFDVLFHEKKDDPYA
ncbi:MAG: adenylate/guanylate cyclase domain-containing protein, partial [Pseudomonadota bacterium]